MNTNEREANWQGGDGAETQSQPPMAVLHVLWRRKRLMTVLLLACVAAGGAYLLFAHRIYSSTALLYVEQTGPWDISETDRKLPPAPNAAYTEAQLIQSVHILGTALQRPGVLQLPTFQGAEDPLKALQDMLTVRVGEKDDVINVTCLSPVPQDAAAIVQAVVDACLGYHAEHSRSSASEVLNILQKEKADQERQRSEWQQAMLKFKQENKTISFEPDKGNVVMDSLNTLSGALTAARLETIHNQADFDAAQQAAGDPVKLRQLAEAALPANSGRTAWESEEGDTRTNLSQAQVQLSILKQEVGENAPAVTATQKRIDELRAQLAEQDNHLAEAYISSARQKLEVSQQQLVGLQEAYDRQHEQAQQLNVKAAEYEVLDTELKRADRLCDLLDARIKDVNLNGDTGALNIAVLQAPQVPTRATKPNPPIVLAASFAVGLLLAFGAVVVRERLDQRLRLPWEVASAMRSPMLGVVPKMHARRRVSVRAAGQFALANTGSAVSEAYRTIRTNIYCRMPQQEAGSVLQVTSPGAGEGKTTLASNMGIVMAQSGQRTLIVDADLRNPMQHIVFQVPKQGGLGEVIAGKMNWAEAVKSTSVDKLDLLTSGGEGVSPSEMLNSPEFAQLLNKLAKNYSYVLIDSSPVMGQADATILAARCDATILALRSGKTDRMMAQHARDSILGVGGKVLGVVVNAVPGRVHCYASLGSRPVSLEPAIAPAFKIEA